MKQVFLVTLLCVVINVLLGLTTLGAVEPFKDSVSPRLGQFSAFDIRIANAPNDVTISVTSGIVSLSWSSVPSATSYIVEGSSFIESGFIGITSSGSYNSTGGISSWSQPGTAAYQFYRVRSVSSSMPENFVLVEGGTFNNGTSDVTVSSFYLDKYELTQAGYQAVMGTNPSVNFGVGANYPVYNVSWYDAIEYCNRRSMNEGITPCYSYSTYGANPTNWPSGWNTNQQNHTNVTCIWSANGYRLPTEMEWMFAARGGNSTHNYTYSGSNTIGDVAWYSSNSGSTNHTVGTKATNELGLFDMSGNVLEWNWDIYGSYPSGSQNNPHGADSGTFRVTRGGSWISNVINCDVSARNDFHVLYIVSYIGFRLCRAFP